LNLSPKYLISLLLLNGYIYKRSKGSHQLYFNPVTKKSIVVPVHGGKDMKKGTFIAILKQAGIERAI